MREEKAGKGVLMEKASRLPLPLSLSLSLSHSLFLAQISLHCDYPVQFCNSYASLPHLVVWPCKGLLVGMETGTVLVPIVRDTKLHSL